MRRALALAILLSGLVLRAQAQTAFSQSVGGGTRWAYPAHLPRYEGTPGVDLSWRPQVARHAVVETDFGWWRGDRTSQPVQSFGQFKV